MLHPRRLLQGPAVLGPAGRWVGRAGGSTQTLSYSSILANSHFRVPTGSPAGLGVAGWVGRPSLNPARAAEFKDALRIRKPIGDPP